jgi:hypothetical protein
MQADFQTAATNEWRQAFYMARNDDGALVGYAIRLAMNGKRGVCLGLPWGRQ